MCRHRHQACFISSTTVARMEVIGTLFFQFPVYLSAALDRMV